MNKNADFITLRSGIDFTDPDTAATLRAKQRGKLRGDDIAAKVMDMYEPTGVQKEQKIDFPWPG